MSNPKRKEIQLSKSIDRYQLDGPTLNEMICLLENLREETNGDARFDISIGTTYYDDDYMEITLHWSRMETDEEYETRCKQHHKRAAAARKAAQKRKEKQEKEERELYKKLKEKFES